MKAIEACIANCRVRDDMDKCQAKNTPMEINAIPASLSLPQHSKFFCSMN
jgi:hypothetical protein